MNNLSEVMARRADLQRLIPNLAKIEHKLQSVCVSNPHSVVALFDRAIDAIEDALQARIKAGYDHISREVADSIAREVTGINSIKSADLLERAQLTQTHLFPMTLSHNKVIYRRNIGTLIDPESLALNETGSGLAPARSFGECLDYIAAGRKLLSRLHVDLDLSLAEIIILRDTAELVAHNLIARTEKAITNGQLPYAYSDQLMVLPEMQHARKICGELSDQHFLNRFLRQVHLCVSASHDIAVKPGYPQKFGMQNLITITAPSLHPTHAEQNNPGNLELRVALGIMENVEKQRSKAVSKAQSSDDILLSQETEVQELIMTLEQCLVAALASGALPLVSTPGWKSVTESVNHTDFENAYRRTPPSLENVFASYMMKKHAVKASLSNDRDNDLIYAQIHG